MKRNKLAKVVLPISVVIACTSTNITTFAQNEGIINNQSAIIYNEEKVAKENFVQNSGFEDGKTVWTFEGSSGAASNNPKNGSKQGYAYYNSSIKQTINIPYNGYYDASAWVKSVGGDAKFTIMNKTTGQEVGSKTIADNSNYELCSMDPIYLNKGDEVEIQLWGAKSWADFDDIVFTYNNSTQENLLTNSNFSDDKGWNSIDVDFINNTANLKQDTSKLSQVVTAPNEGKYFLDVDIKPLSDNVKIKVKDKTITLNKSEEYQTIRLDNIVLNKNEDTEIVIEGMSEVRETTLKYDIENMDFNKPTVENLVIDGSYTIDSTVKINYDFIDLDNHFEGDTKIKWLVSDSKDGEYSVVDDKNNESFYIAENYHQKYIKCEVTPVDEFGISGEPTYSNVAGPIRINAIKNPSFEDSGLGWKYNGANIRYDDALDAGIRARIAKGDFNFMTQEIEVKETGYYDLSAYAKTENSDAKMGIMTLASEPKDNEIVNCINLNPTSGYTQAKIDNILLEKGEKIKVFFTGGNTSSVSVDRVELIKLEDAKTKNLNNIIDFKVDNQEGNATINKDNKTINITVPYKTNVKKLNVEEIKLSQGASTKLKEGSKINLSKPYELEVKSKKGETSTWTINCEVERKETKATSSNKFLEENFNWAIDKTEQFVMTGKTGLINRDENNNDGSHIGEYMPSYWAGYYDRTAFYSRDFVHQATGGQIAGLSNENFEMFKTFAKNSTESRKWYTLWAINFDGSAHTIDYKDDSWFVREIPAQFELVEKAYEQYLWTGDERYIEDEDLWNFYTMVMTEFIDLHDDQNPNGIPEGKGGIFEGSCTYNERGEHPIEAGDAIGSQYQATLAYAGMLEARGEEDEAEKWYKKAEELKKYFNEEWSVIDPNNKDDHYARIIVKDTENENSVIKKNDFGKENSWFMPMKLITEPGERNDKYLDYIEENLGNGIGTTPNAPWNIEAYTYIPETYFPYNRNEEAWKWMKYIMNTKDEAHERPTQGTNGDYPEISFTFISHTIEGLMGIEPNADENEIITASHLPNEVDWLKIENLEMGEHELTVKHNGLTKTSLTNKSDEELNWEARFYGEYDYIKVDGKKVKAKKKKVNGVQVSYVEVEVDKNETVIAEAVK